MRLNFLLLVITLFIGDRLQSQDTLWISEGGNYVSSKDSAKQYQLITKSDSHSQQVRVSIFELDGTLVSESNFNPYRPKPLLHGISKKYSFGQLADERVYTNGVLNGYHKTYWENGSLKRNDLYEKGNFISGVCYGSNGSDTTWFPYQINASFPGGPDSLHSFIARNLKYPPFAIPLGIAGTVNIRFVVRKDGSLDGIRLVNAVSPLLDQEALRVVKLMPTWTPGIIDGRTVNMSFQLPITFKLNY